MSFTASLSTTGNTAVITLAGSLDDTGAEQFREEVAKAASQGVSRLVLEMSKLEKLSAAGLRGLAFCREKMTTDVDIVFVAPNATVRKAIEDVGFEQRVTISDRFTL
jgi:anti-anti-sigma factor